MNKFLNIDHEIELNDIIKFANSQKYNIGKKPALAEGIVVKHSIDRRISFKVISQEYLAKEA